MLSKNLWLSLLVLAALNPLTNPALAMDEDDADPMYFRLGYNFACGEQKIDGAKELKVENSTNAASKGMKPTIIITDTEYKPKYALNFLGGNVAVGQYFSDDARVELEIAIHSKFELDQAETTTTDSSYTVLQADVGNKRFVPLPATPTVADPVANDVMTLKTTSGDNTIFGFSDKANAAFKNKGFDFGVASLNLYYELNNAAGSMFEPYISAGVGLARLDFSSDPTSENITYPFVAQLRAGVKFNVTNFAPIYAGYKFMHLFSNQSNDEISAIMPAGSTQTAKLKTSYTLHNLDVGFMFVI